MSTFSVSRSITIDAPQERVHSLISNLHEWEQWSPWQDTDPRMVQTYSGPESGEGASMHWSGNRDAGEGTMTVLSSTPNQIDVAIAFLRPFKAENRASFSLGAAPDHHEGSVRVTWTMSGAQNLLQKAFWVLGGMERKLNGDFDKGLLRLRNRAEGK